jgi:hypothetical protein
VRSHLASFCAYSVVVGLAATYIAKHPEYNWDLIPYVGAVLESDGQSVQAVHRETYRLVRAAVPEARFNEFLSTPYNRGVFENPEYLAQQMPFYKIRPGYLVLVRLLHRFGVELVAATVALSVGCYIGISLILWFWIGRTLWGPAQLACAACLALSQPLLEAGGLTTPDALSSLLVLVAFFLLVEFDQVVGAGLLLLVSLLVRSDNLILCVLFAALLFHRSRSAAVWKRAVAPAYAGLALLVVVICHRAAANYGWRITIYHSFIAALLAPADATPELSLRTFAKILVGGAASVRYSSIGLCVLLWVCALFLNRSTAPGSRDLWRMRAAYVMVASVLIHVLVFPVFRDRFFVAQYLIVCVVSVGSLLRAHRGEPKSQSNRPLEPLKALTG